MLRKKAFGVVVVVVVILHNHKPTNPYFCAKATSICEMGKHLQIYKNEISGLTQSFCNKNKGW